MGDIQLKIDGEMNYLTSGVGTKVKAQTNQDLWTFYPGAFFKVNMASG